MGFRSSQNARKIGFVGLLAGVAYASSDPLIRVALGRTITRKLSSNMLTNKSSSFESSPCPLSIQGNFGAWLHVLSWCRIFCLIQVACQLA